MKFSAVMGGLLSGLKMGTVLSLDGMPDEKVTELLTTGLRTISEKLELPTERKKRLLDLLHRVVIKVHDEL